MNVKLQINLEFSAGIYFNDQLRLNRYSAALQMCTATTDHDQINIAMDRLKIFVYSELADTVFVNQDDDERVQVLDLLGINVTTLPADPIDQVVGLALYTKLNAIMEGRIFIETLDISSTLGDDVIYMYEAGDPIGPFQTDGWWMLSDTSHSSVIEIETEENVVKVPNTGWTRYNLNWNDPDNTGKTVFFGKLSKDAK
jgi:hypothetical protein